MPCNLLIEPIFCLLQNTFVSSPIQRDSAITWCAPGWLQIRTHDSGLVVGVTPTHQYSEPGFLGFGTPANLVRAMSIVEYEFRALQNVCVLASTQSQELSLSHFTSRLPLALLLMFNLLFRVFSLQLKSQTQSVHLMLSQMRSHQLQAVDYMFTIGARPFQWRKGQVKFVLFQIVFLISQELSQHILILRECDNAISVSIFP